MTLLQPLPETVPPDELAAVLREAILRASGGPVFAAAVTGRHLADALALAGFKVIRADQAGLQLTL